MNQEHYNKISAYCTSTERCISEVRERMRKLEVPEGEWDEIVERLQTEGFIDERRYAEAFTKDKFRFAKWGKRKIEYALRGKGISGAYIQAAFSSIDEDEYQKVKEQLAKSKAKGLKGDKDSMENRSKILRFLASRGFTLALLLTFISPKIFASGYIEGVAWDYVGEKLELYYEDNGITKQPVTVDTCTVDVSGHFKFETDITETRKCFINLGYYKGALYVEPYKIYNINLPSNTDITEAQSLNPYFEPKEILLSLNNPSKDDINIKISEFDDAFDAAFNRIISGVISTDSIEKEYMELEYEYGDTHPFFTTYRYCSYAIMVNLYEPTQPNTAIDAFFIDEPIAYNNPAYWDAFDVLFEQYRDIEALNANKELQELVIIHHVLAGKYSEEWLYHIKSPHNSEIANQVRNIIRSGAVGTILNTTEFINLNGDSADLKDFDSPQIYIIFANSKLAQSLSDLDYALKNNAKWKGKCVALIIFTNSDINNIAKQANVQNCKKYIMLASQNREFIKSFNIKAAPAYFRIDFNGKILESPAPTPAEFNL